MVESTVALDKKKETGASGKNNVLLSWNEEKQIHKKIPTE